MDRYASKSTRNKCEFPVGYELLKFAMAGGKETYGGDATGKKLGEETVVHGAVRCSGKPSSARRGHEGNVAAASRRGWSSRSGRCGEEERETPRTPIYSR